MLDIRDIISAFNEEKKWKLDVNSRILKFKFNDIDYSVEYDLYDENIILLFSIVKIVKDKSSIDDNLLKNILLYNNSWDAQFGSLSISGKTGNIICQCRLHKNSKIDSTRMQVFVSKFIKRSEDSKAKFTNNNYQISPDNKIF